MPFSHDSLIGHLVRRFLYLPVTLLLLSLAVFLLSRAAPGDTVERRMSAHGSRAAAYDPAAYANEYRRLAAELGRDRPWFYFSLSSQALPDTFYRIVVRERRLALRALAFHYGNWPAVQHYYTTVLRLANLNEEQVTPIALATARRLLRERDVAMVAAEVASLRRVSHPLARSLRRAHHNLAERANLSVALRPRLRWHGIDNQYHHFLTGLLAAEVGTSLVDRRPVTDKILAALPVTLTLNVVALLVVYLLGVPLGLYQARWGGGGFDRWTILLTFVAFGLPSFWIATLLVNFFTTPAYGMEFLPSMGLGYVPEGSSWWRVWSVRSQHLLLPVLCLAYPSWAYVSRHLRSAALEEYVQPYVMTARMNGLSENRVLWGHIFRNAAFPLVTMLGGLLPALLAGSVVIERIFNLPGMGQLLYDAALGRDWPVLTALVMINGLLTAVGLLVADMGYVLLDPRVSLSRRRWR